MYMVCKMIFDYYHTEIFPYNNKFWSLESILLHYTEHTINPMLILVDGLRTMWRLAQQYKKRAMCMEGWPNDRDQHAFHRNHKMILASLVLYRKWSDEDGGRAMAGGGGVSHAPSASGYN